jgi:ATP-dependent Clp protease ATP-binding subunit ClpA
VLVNDLEISQQQVSEPAQRLLDRAAEKARRRHHTQLWDAHPLLAFAHTERDLFHAAFEDIGVDGARVIAQIEAFLDTIPSGPERELRIPTQTRLVCKLALRSANRVGRPVMTPADASRFHVRTMADRIEIDASAAEEICSAA